MPARKTNKILTIQGSVNGRRVSSRMLEENIQDAVREGARELLIKADGQHGIGGRIWPRKEKVKLTVEGPSGQRLGSMGMMGTEIVAKSGASDDVGWINCGARITVLGDVTNGAHNAAAQGVLYVQGGGGARCDTMTKHNPRFDPPESWYFRDVGDSFAEFKAGGTAVVCGVNPRNPHNILGYRPCVGMVGGTIYLRGPVEGYREWDVKLLDLTPEDWKWLKDKMKPFLKAVDRESYYKELTASQGAWKKLIAHTPAERSKRKRFPVSMAEFRANEWEKDTGQGGIFAEYVGESPTLPYITTGADRRNRPVWANEKYLPPCAFACPTRIPSHKRARLLRQGQRKKALEMVLEYSPLPATVCGQVCPNLCMDRCTRGRVDRPLNIKELGSLALTLPAPKPARSTGHKVAIIGGGPAGMSAAWQLALKGHTVDLYEAEKRLGGKIELCIPRQRLPQKILLKEISRFKEIGVKLHLGKRVTAKDFEKIYKDHSQIIIASGAHAPRELKFEGYEKALYAINFLKDVNAGQGPVLKDKRVVVVGAGNVGMDVAAQAYHGGAIKVTAVDVQKPAAFGRELELAKSLGTEIIWPKFVKKYDKKARKVTFTDGTGLGADMLIVSIGETPEVGFLPRGVHTERGHIVVDEKTYQTTDIKIFAIGDATGPGLVTHAIGHGRTVAEYIHSELMHYDFMPEVRQAVPYDRIRTDYYDLCKTEIFKPKAEANLCMSCATCRDCHMCEATCYYGAISRVGYEDGSYEYVVDDNKCIGCGFCAGICPCGVWEMVENL